MIHYLTIICFIVILAEVLSQNGRARNGTACSTKGCIKQHNMVLLIFGMTAGILLLLGCFVLLIMCSGRKKKSKRLNNKDIEMSQETENEANIPFNINDIFESGQWSSRYYRHDNFRGPFLHGIVFNIDQNILQGSGIDDIGYYTLTGTISTELLTMNMIKKYRSSIRKTQKHLGREVKIDLEWNHEKCAFEGRWFVHRYGFNDEGSYELVKVQ